MLPMVANIQEDIRNFDSVSNIFKEHKPDIVLQFMAQPLVRHSYRSPIETYETNVMGTINILEAETQIQLK